MDPLTGYCFGGIMLNVDDDITTRFPWRRGHAGREIPAKRARARDHLCLILGFGIPLIPLVGVDSAEGTEVSAASDVATVSAENSLQNGSFEQPDVYQYRETSDVPYWKSTTTSGNIEIGSVFKNGNGDNDSLHMRTGEKVAAAEGSQFGKPATSNGNYSIYQRLATTQGAKYRWSLKHRARPSGEDYAEFKRIDAYNATVPGKGVPDAFAVTTPEEDAEYASFLNEDPNGVMAYINIPRLKSTLPIYHYTTPESLQKDVGHLRGSALPVGGKNTHAVLSAHRGLPTSRLFTDLDKVRKGDHFYITVLNRTLAYEVDRISVVKPDQTKELSVQPGKDLVTLAIALAGIAVLRRNTAARTPHHAADWPHSLTVSVR